MASLTDQMNTILEHLGKSFLLAAYLPSALFLGALQLFVLVSAPLPLVTPYTVAADASQIQVADGGNWLNAVVQATSALLLPILLGVLLMALNTVIIRMFEGAYGWERRLLGFWLGRNRSRARQLYGKLTQLKQEYTAYLGNPTPGLDPNQAAQAAASLALEIQKEHDRLDQVAPVQILPRREGLVRPTALGNAFVVLEEYPYERYGMDAMVFWPRLRPLVDSEYGAQLTGYKMLLDMLLNIAFLAIVFGLVCLALTIRTWAWLPFLATGIAWVIAYATYQGGVQIVLSMKEVIALCFDFYRHRLLEKLDLSAPPDLQGEQALWLQLGQFLRRGEGFYHPQWQVLVEKGPK